MFLNRVLMSVEGPGQEAVMSDTSGRSASSDDDVLRLTSEIVASYVANNSIAPDTLPDIIRSVHAAMSALGRGSGAEPEERPRPAVPVAKSVTRDYIVCLEDGRKLKMLKRYLRSRYDMSPDEYRRRWGLPADYPMVAPSYTTTRSEHAKRIGLGKGVRKGR
jgi:predicted transcriptional regulator